MTTPASGAQVHHTPDDGTAQYDAVVDGSVLRVVRMVEGVAVVLDYVDHDGIWRRPVGGGGVWRRVYTPNVPATTPPTGRYVVQEFTDEPPAWTTREEGAYRA